MAKFIVVPFKISKDGNEDVAAGYATRDAIQRFSREGTGAYEVEGGEEKEVDESELDNKGCWRPKKKD